MWISVSRLSSLKGNSTNFSYEYQFTSHAVHNSGRENSCAVFSVALEETANWGHEVEKIVDICQAGCNFRNTCLSCNMGSVGYWCTV